MKVSLHRVGRGGSGREVIIKRAVGIDVEFKGYKAGGTVGHVLTIW